MPQRRNNEDHPDQLALPTFQPRVRFEPTVIPLGGGKFEVHAGKPIVEEAVSEIDTAEFARRTGLTQGYVQQMCSQGVIKCRRMSLKPDSKFLIPVTELDRHYTGTRRDS